LFGGAKPTKAPRGDGTVLGAHSKVEYTYIAVAVEEPLTTAYLHTAEPSPDSFQ